MAYDGDPITSAFLRPLRQGCATRSTPENDADPDPASRPGRGSVQGLNRGPEACNSADSRGEWRPFNPCALGVRLDFPGPGILDYLGNRSRRSETFHL